MTTRKVRMEYSAASVVVSLILSGIFGSWYVSEKFEEQGKELAQRELQQRQADLAMCELVQAVTQVPPNPDVAKPTTEFGRQVVASQELVQRRLKNLQEKLQCP